MIAFVPREPALPIITAWLTSHSFPRGDSKSEREENNQRTDNELRDKKRLKAISTAPTTFCIFYGAVMRGF